MRESYVSVAGNVPSPAEAILIVAKKMENSPSSPTHQATEGPSMIEVWTPSCEIEEDGIP